MQAEHVARAGPETAFWRFGAERRACLSLREDDLPAACPELEWGLKKGQGIHHMPDWIAKANIEHFKKLLETEKDARRRAVIECELAEEEAKFTELLKKQGEQRRD